MGIWIKPSNDHMVLPVVYSNAEGTECWSGLHVDHLTDEHMRRLLRYCRTEGYRAGWNNSVCKVVGEWRDGPFSPELLAGQLHQLWVDSYDEGVAEQQDR